MGIEDEIKRRLVEGHPVEQLVADGFRKTTIYKVKSALATKSADQPRPLWYVSTNSLQGKRFKPGDNMFVDWSVTNVSGLDLYVHTAGMEPEWFRRNGQWYPVEIRSLIKPGATHTLPQKIVPIPNEVTLGEYDLRFGLQSQFLSPTLQQTSLLNQIQWSEPMIANVKHPICGSIFLSHSTRNMSLVRQLQKHLDLYGFEGVIAEDIMDPGKYLPVKFQEKVQRCSYFMALLTKEATESDWVLYEVRYARQIGKPLILLKEDNVSVPNDLALTEWVPFSRLDSAENLAHKIEEATRCVANVVASPVTLPIGAVVIGGILIFLAGLALGSKR